MRKGYVYLVLAALSYASMSVLIKALSTDFGPFWQTFLRLIVSAVLTLLLVVYTKQSFKLRRRSDYPLIAVMGIIGYGLQIMLFTASLYHNTIGNTLFIFSAYPILAAVLAHFILKERVNRRLGVALVLLLCVLFLLFDPAHVTGYLLGNTYALGACLCFAVYVICSRILAKRGNTAGTITLWSVSLAVVTSGLAAAAFEKAVFVWSPSAIAYLLIFGLLNAAAFNFVNRGFATVNAGIGTMILLLEPLIGSLLGLVLFHEIPTVTFAIGAVIMVAAVYIASFKLD
jgi:drug/metabolite transporter (DMT)-like permease